jgi:hypothetical protein
MMIKVTPAEWPPSWRYLEGVYFMHLTLTCIFCEKKSLQQPESVPRPLQHTSSTTFLRLAWPVVCLFQPAAVTACTLRFPSLLTNFWVGYFFLRSSLQMDTTMSRVWETWLYPSLYICVT